MPIYMVAALVCPSLLRAEGLRTDSRAPNPYIVALMMGDSRFRADGYPLFSGERPPPEEVHKWLEAAALLLTTDESSLVRSMSPHIVAPTMRDGKLDADGHPLFPVKRPPPEEVHKWLEAAALFSLGYIHLEPHALGTYTWNFM